MSRALLLNGSPVSGWAELDRELSARFVARARYHVRAPGRVNLIGEHTDYNEGFVLPVAIDRAVRLAAAPTADPLLRFRSRQFDEEVALPVDRPEEPRLPQWARYIQGVAGQLLRAGVALRGTAAVVDGDLPPGAGLSSSAAMEVAAALALLAAAGATLDRRRVALLAQRAEVEFVGVRCGIMDQLTVALGRPGHALLIDCRSLEISYIPLPPTLALVVCDTGVRRALGESAYNDRRRECEVAVQRLRRVRPQIRALRDVGPEEWSLLDDLPEPLRRRARHVVTENQRVRDAVETLRRGDGVAVGRLLNASHASLRDDYAVSVPALEAMVEAAMAAPGALGARLTGAGFGGAVLALVERDATGVFVERTRTAYQTATGREGAFRVCAASGGAEVELTGAPG